MIGVMLSICLGVCGKLIDNHYNDKINEIDELKTLNVDATVELLNSDDEDGYKNGDKVICFLPKYFTDYRFFHITEEETLLFIKNNVEFVLERGSESNTEYVYTKTFGTDGLYLQLEKQNGDYQLMDMAAHKNDFKYKFDYLKTRRNALYGSSVGIGLYSMFKLLKKIK